MKVAKDLGVATTCVREALFELESQGFVTRLTNKGTFVTRLSKDDIAQISRIRTELEGLAVELVEQRATPDDITALRDIVVEMEAAARANHLEAFYRADLEFHRKIWTLSGNRHLTKALDITVVPLFAFFIMRNPGDSLSELVKSVEWHGRIVDAISDRRGARQCMQEALHFFSQQETWMLFESPRNPA
jgi:DNA-binding GntR family transcriptional regulator